MSNLKQYIPILKWKPAEKRALLELGKKHKNFIVPLIELVMPTVSRDKTINKEKIRKSPEEMFKEIITKFNSKRLKEIPEEILECWGTNPVYLDFSLLHNAEKTTQLKVDSLNNILPAGIDLGLKIIPVLNLNDEKIIKKTICSFQKKHNQLVCLRITTSDLEDEKKLNKKIQTFLSDCDLSRKNIDLLIDIKATEEDEDKYLKFINISQKINKLLEWRSFIFASGAFPETVGECKLDEPNYLPRTDWQNWLNFTRRKQITRYPVFADYTVRSPIFKESLQYFRSTTSIKYTLDDNWLVLKGKVGEHGLYLVNAKLLVEDTKHFYGKKLSWGDDNIYQKSKHYHEWVKDNSIKGTGRTGDWIAWSINHHLSLVVNQLSSLF